MARQFSLWLGPNLSAALALVNAVQAQNIELAVHDWTVSTTTKTFREAWADVKSPGGFPALGAVPDVRRTYAVGTVEVDDTGPLASFSNAPASSGTIPSFTFPGPGLRQVAMLQINDAAGIVRQRYFYGTGGATNGRSTNARAVSVWEGATPNETRVAICGETYDDALFMSQALAGWPLANATNPTGFIAVFNGDGDLLWAHHFFAGNDPSADCAVTDISIRVDAFGTETVTYCGIFTHGDPGAGTPLSPMSWFPSPASGCSSGNTVQAAGQVDGFVGRLQRPSSVQNASPVFHSIVGSNGEDLLLGLAELDENRFAVVGSTFIGNPAAVSDFPIPDLAGVNGAFRVGTLLLFAQTPTGLQVLDGQVIGGVISGVATIARDVCVGFNAGLPGQHMLYVVGSTEDAAFNVFPSSIAWLIPPTYGQNTFAGVRDGFIAAYLADTSTLTPWSYALWGTQSEDGFTGVSCWSEFPEHVAAVGFTTVRNLDIGVQTYFLNRSTGPANPPGSTAPPNGTSQLHPIRNVALGADNNERPAAMGPINITTAGVVLALGLLGQESGGGIAAGNDGRINVVGIDPLIPGNLPFPTVPLGGRGADAGDDGVRAEVDMVPQSPNGLPGVGRTDGTGFQAATPVFPPPPASGLTGGTTPTCALTPFGVRLGEPAPVLSRMLIDFEGTLAPGSTNTAIIVSKNVGILGDIAIGVLQFGLPPSTPWAVITGCEIWLGDPAAGYAWFPDPLTNGNQAFRLPLAALPNPGGVTISAQLVGLLAIPIGAGSCATSWVASPALWFSY